MAQAAIIAKCDLCESENKVDYFCTNCEETLCMNCKIAHVKSKKTRNDRIIPLTQAREDGIVKKSMTVFCDEHSSVEVTLFCLKCNQLVCTQCLAGKHNTHQVTIPDEIRDSKVKELKKLIRKLKEKKAVYENAFDTEGKVHSHFLKSIDQVRKEITDQKANIIEELNLVCDEQFSELKIFLENEDKRYSEACSKIQVQNQAVTTAIQTAETSVTSSNSNIIIQTTVNATQTLQGTEEPVMPPTTVATYQPGDKSRPNIRNVQGKINIEQTMKSTNQPADRRHSTTPQVQDRENIQQATKPKHKEDIHKVKLQQQKTSGDDQQQQRHEVSKPSINVKKVRVKSSVNVQGKGNIYVIVPLQNKTAWVQAIYDHHLTLIDSTGKIITTSVSLDNEIHDAKLYRNGLLVTCINHCKVHQLSAEGKSTSTFADLSPFQAWGLCVTHNMEVMVCLQSSNDNKVVRLNTTGRIIQTIQHDATGAALYGFPWTVTSLTSGEVIVVDRGNNNVVGVDREGKHLFTWKGEIQGWKLDVYSLRCITHDSNNNLFVTDIMYNRVFVLGKDGSGGMCLLDITQGIDGPCGTAVDNTGKLWVGCCKGNIHIIEY